MDDVTVGTTARLSVQAISAAMAEIFGENVPPHVYADGYRTTNVDLMHSVVAHAPDGAIAGLAMLAYRGERGYCPDLGVQPAWRGRGLAHRLVAALLQSARACGLRTVQLDVLAENAPAIRVYERAGFRPMLGRVVLDAPARSLAAVQCSDAAPRVDDCAPDDLLGWFDPAEPPPCWEREPATLLALSPLRAAQATRDGRPVAFLLWAPAMWDGRVRPRHIGLRAGARPADAHALLLHAAGSADAVLRVGLEPVGSRCDAMLRTLRFRERSRWHEMHCALDSQ